MMFVSNLRTVDAVRAKGSGLNVSDPKTGDK
jgi:hypothetical protein